MTAENQQHKCGKTTTNFIQKKKKKQKPGILYRPLQLS